MGPCEALKEDVVGHLIEGRISDFVHLQARAELERLDQAASVSYERVLVPPATDEGAGKPTTTQEPAPGTEAPVILADLTAAVDKARARLRSAQVAAACQEITRLRGAAESRYARILMAAPDTPPAASTPEPLASDGTITFDVASLPMR